MQKAKYLLANENLSIAEVTFKVGFSTQGYFSNVFKSKFGCTPSEYKEQFKNVKQKIEKSLYDGDHCRPVVLIIPQEAPNNS
jgi:AraC-like DNA-binding protein